MSWFSGQTWLWYLLAFAVGVLIAWLLLVLPAQRRLRALGDAPADVVPAPATVAATVAATGTAAAFGADRDPDDGTTAAPAGSRERDDEHPREDTPQRPEPDPWNARTQQLPAVDSALATLDSGTGSFRLGLGQATSALFPDPPRPTGRVRPAARDTAARDTAAAGAAPPADAPEAPPNDTPTPRSGIPVVPPADGDEHSLFDDSTPQRPGRAPGDG